MSGPMDGRRRARTQQQELDLGGVFFLGFCQLFLKCSILAELLRDLWRLRCALAHGVFKRSRGPQPRISVGDAGV